MNDFLRPDLKVSSTSQAVSPQTQWNVSQLLVPPVVQYTPHARLRRAPARRLAVGTCVWYRGRVERGLLHSAGAEVQGVVSRTDTAPGSKRGGCAWKARAGPDGRCEKAGKGEYAGPGACNCRNYTARWRLNSHASRSRSRPPHEAGQYRERLKQAST